jgi:glycosyltransferase involved in cell wall biosynthesis
MTNKKTKILMVNTNHVIYDGITMTILNYVTSMDKDDIQIDLLTSNQVEKKLHSQIENMGCRLHKIAPRKKNTLKYIFDLAKLIRKEKYDVVHIHCSSRTATIDLLGTFIGGAKLRCTHSHNTKCENPKMHKLFKPLFNILYTDAFACGEEAGQWLYQNRKFTVLKNGTNFDKYKFNPDIRKKYRSKYLIDDKIAIGSVANFTHHKNHEFLIDVFSKVIVENSKYILFLIGDGKYKDSIVEKVNKLDLQNNVVFTGTILDIPEMLSAMDFMVLPSLYEGLPNVVIEWQISGLPALVANTVTEDCKLTDLVIFLPLKKNVWKENILKMGVLENRIDYIDEINKAGFNIAENAKFLKNYYLNRLNIS